MRGDGFIFQRGPWWYYGYCRAGKYRRVSLKTQDQEIAEKRAKVIRDGLIRGEIPFHEKQRVLVSHLLDDLQTHLELQKRASAQKAKSMLKPIRVAFGDIPADRLETAAVERYQRERLEDGYAPAGINRGCELLRQAFRLAANRTPRKVATVPMIPLLPVDNARQGFMSRADFLALLKAIPDADIRDYLEFFWWTGMRPGEIRQLTWDMMNRETWTLHLAPRADKTRKGRTIPLLDTEDKPTPVYDVLQRRLKRRSLSTPLIFHRVSRRRPGQPVKDFRTSWRQALAKTGLAPGLRPYDLRRTALRNMLRGGTDIAVAMRISGHRTRATFDRYNITSEEDIAAAMARTAQYVETLPKKRKVARMKR